MIEMDKNAEQFKSLLRSTQRQGVENVISKLDSLGFFSAPASATHHMNVPGGLVQHSLNVYEISKRIKPLVSEMNPACELYFDDNSIIIASLLHDVCKAEIYKPAIKKRKSPQGYWQDYNGYDIDQSTFPMGHGEKSVIQLLKWGLDMKEEEMLAIRWHMMAWDLPFQSYEAKECLSKALEKSPLVKLIQSADGIATNIIEL